MFGLIVLGVIVIYIAFFIFVIKSVTRWARNTGRGVKRWGVIAALAVYLPVFWDHIPTVLLHRYVCATEQGFWVYKTLEQWQRENPGVAETLTPYEKLVQYKAEGIQNGYMLNQRFAREVLKKRKPLSFLPVSVYEENIIDYVTREILAKQIRVGSGYGNMALGGEGSWKFWLEQPDCNSSRKQFSKYKSEIKYQGVEQ